MKNSLMALMMVVMAFTLYPVNDDKGNAVVDQNGAAVVNAVSDEELATMGGDAE